MSPHDLKEREERRPVTLPYGPHDGKVDEASGGGDSSPVENLSTDEREELQKRSNPEREERGP